ncbi:phosphatidylinositol N-acetylglucosaminyltransferase subunit H [Bombyx mori]|uniref:Phosphatidylinositol N-acetylglucosaminyltransferase subunit H conserved domain-containing protein n=1 Tax=Bombyx mori TaxID=7091 RepID=A0A8R2G9J2_BOMMO|nr:phosphatidylinositol N-acetylglucosaminyltransferase subunit H isoform X3 [Bombyx mori]
MKMMTRCIPEKNKGFFKRLDKCLLLSHENSEGLKINLMIEKGGIPNYMQFDISFNLEKSYSYKSSKLFLLWSVILLNCLIVTYVGITLELVITFFTICMCLAIIWFRMLKSETVLIVPNVGIRSTQNYPTRNLHTFVSWDRIEDIIINEVIVTSKVLYYLTILVKEDPENTGNIEQNQSTRLVPLFLRTRPSLAVLEKIYADVQDLLTEAKQQV